MRTPIPNNKIALVKTLRNTLDDKGRKTPLSKIEKKAKLTPRQVKYILYETGTRRARELAQIRNDAYGERAKNNGEYITARYSYGILGLPPSKIFDLLKKKQSNHCAICKNQLNGDRRHMVVDHDHKTGKIRGLLCYTCNNGLGQFRDNPLFLQNAISYLEKPQTDYLYRDVSKSKSPISLSQ